MDINLIDDVHDDDDSENERVAVMSRKLSCIEPVTKNKYILEILVFDAADSYPDVRSRLALTVEGSVHCVFSHHQRITGVALVDGLIHSFVGSKEKTEVGCLEGTLLRRPNDSFFSIADDLNEEIIGLAMQFCRPDGTTKLNHPELKPHNANGGFFHIYKVQIHPDHSGRDLGLRMVYESLKLLPWTLSVMAPGVLGRRSHFARAEEYNSNPKFYYEPEQEPFQEVEEDPKNQELLDAARMKVYHHFARLGFVQAGKNPDYCDSFFLTKKMFQETILGGAELTDSTDMKLLSKEHVAAHANIYVPPKPHKPNELEIQLEAFVREQNESLAMIRERTGEMFKSVSASLATLHDTETTSGEMIPSARQQLDQITNELREQQEYVANKINEILESMRERIAQSLAAGATIDGARLLHRYAANVSSSHTFTDILKILVDLGANPDLRDELGLTPLMIASAHGNLKVVDFLISVGADPSAKDLSGNTAIDNCLSAFRSKREYDPVFGPARLDERLCVPVFEAATALMLKSQRDTLLDGIVPPRVHHVLSIAAEMQLDEYSDISTFDPTAFEEDPDLAEEQIRRYRLDFIPMSEVDWLYDPQEEYWKILMSGYRAIWKATSQVLEKGHAPTVDRVRQALGEFSPDECPRGFDNWTGIKIEYVLDALFDTASDLHQDQWFEADTMDELPDNPLDDYYDLLWFMCVVRGGGQWEKDQNRGPFRSWWEDRLGEED